MCDSEEGFYITSAATRRWVVAHALKKGRKVSQNMLVVRRALENNLSRRLINLSDVNVVATIVRQAEGSAKLFGYFYTYCDHYGHKGITTTRTSCLWMLCWTLRARRFPLCDRSLPRVRGDGIPVSFTHASLWKGVLPSGSRTLQQVDGAVQNAEKLTQLPPVIRSNM